jgi:methyl-galactoside transport system substrate-binding protein
MLIVLGLTTLLLISDTKVNRVTSTSLYLNNRRVVNVGVLMYSFEDLFMTQLKEDLQEIQNQNKDKVQFTFYDGKNNIAIQAETLDSLLNSNIDLFILNLANTEESVMKDFILKVKQKNVPVIVLEAFPQAIAELSKYYDKAAFVGPADTKQAGIQQGKILVDKWNSNKEIIDKNNDDILQYVLLKGEAGNPVAEERTSYSISTINDAGIKTEELASINANWFEGLAKEAINNIFLRYDGRIEAIIANNDAMAIGAIKTLQKYGYNAGDKSKYVSVVGIDALPEARDLVDKGIMTGTVVQDSKLLAEGLYKVGMNLVNQEEPIANTNYKIVDGLIEIPLKYQQYVRKVD